LKTLKPFTKSQIEKGWGIHELCGVTVKRFNNAWFQKGILGVLLLSQGNQDWKQGVVQGIQTCLLVGCQICCKWRYVHCTFQELDVAHQLSMLHTTPVDVHPQCGK
jgi:hypothetical protein